MQKAPSKDLLVRQQYSSDVLWGLTKNYSSYLYKNNSYSFSRDPLNLTGLNTKRDSGICATAAIGIGYEIVSDRKIKEKKAKKKGKVLRLTLRIKTKRLIPKKHLTLRKDDKGVLVQPALNKQNVPVHNRSVFVEHRRLSTRSCIKVIKRGLTNYRGDLVNLAVRRLKRLHKFKKINKWNNRRESKKTK